MVNVTPPSTPRRGYLRGRNTQVISNALKLQRLERKVRRLQGETKFNNTAAAAVAVAAGGGYKIYELTAIQQGDDVNMRDGRKINVTGVDLRVHSTQQSLDTFLVLSPNGDEPIAADFENVVGGHLTVTGASTHKILSHVHNYSGANFYARYRRRFKKPIPVKYTGTATTDGDLNRIWVVFSNHFGTAATVDFSAKIYYKDH